MLPRFSFPLPVLRGRCRQSARLPVMLLRDSTRREVGPKRLEARCCCTARGLCPRILRSTCDALSHLPVNRNRSTAGEAGGPLRARRHGARRGTIR